MVRAAVVSPKAGQVTVTDRIDRLAAHPILTGFLPLGVMGLLFWLTYLTSTPLQAWLGTHHEYPGAGCGARRHDEPRFSLPLAVSGNGQQD